VSPTPAPTEAPTPAPTEAPTPSPTQAPNNCGNVNCQPSETCCQDWFFDYCCPEGTVCNGGSCAFF
jgi:hypothetical protein